MKRVIGIAGLGLALAAGGLAVAHWGCQAEDGNVPLVLHGNVDLRQVDLPFNGQQRVARMLVEEGDKVTEGQTLAWLDTTRLQAAVTEAEARVAAQQQVIERLASGARPEEIDEARANLAAAESERNLKQIAYNRIVQLRERSAASEQEIDDARMALESAAARRDARQASLDLALAGSRAEDKAEAAATLSALEAQLQTRRIELGDAELKSPVTGVVRNRIMEPGEMSSPGVPAISIAVTDPKWVRAYVNEPDLGSVRPGTPAAVTVDAFPGRTFDGWIGFVSPVAEFTPKNVESEELRTSLVYEVRVYFRDPMDMLRLGMPATVRVLPGSGPVSQALRSSER